MKKNKLISIITGISLLNILIIFMNKHRLEKSNFINKIYKNNIVDISDEKYTYDNLKIDLRHLLKQYSKYMEFNVLNTTYDKRNIYEVILGNKSAENHFLIHGGIHGREYLNCLLIMKILEDYLKDMKNKSYKGIKYKDLFENTALHIIPMVNPDGVMISECGMDAIRNLKLRNKIIDVYKNDCKNKNTEENFDDYLIKWKANGRGVDLNRNFNADWELINQHYDNSYKDYKGIECESEIETKTLVELTNKYNFIGTISYHSSGNIIYWDYSKSKVKNQSSYMADIAKMITSYEKADSDNKYKDVVSGGYKDWASSKENKPIPSITIEVGEGECPLNISEFNKAYICNKNLWLEYIYLSNINKGKDLYE